MRTLTPTNEACQSPLRRGNCRICKRDEDALTPHKLDREWGFWRTKHSFDLAFGDIDFTVAYVCTLAKHVLQQNDYLLFRSDIHEYEPINSRYWHLVRCYSVCVKHTTSSPMSPSIMLNTHES